MVMFAHYDFCYCIYINRVIGMFLYLWSALHEHECEDGHDHLDTSYAMGPNAINTSIASYYSDAT